MLVQLVGRVFRERERERERERKYQQLLDGRVANARKGVVIVKEWNIHDPHPLVYF